MPIDADRRARLFYDASCGPCRFFAESVTGLSRGRLEPVPLDSDPARRELGGLREEQRFGSAHVVDRGVRASGPEIVRPLIGAVLGPTAERAVDRFPALARPLGWLYVRFWRHRRDHGCATGG